MGSPRQESKKPHPGPELETQRYASNDVRLRRAAALVDEIWYAAHGKTVKSDIDIDWLKALAAPDWGSPPNPLLTRWATLFAEEIELVQRARNSIEFGESIGDGNLEAAADIAERLVDVARRAGQSVMSEVGR